MTDYARIAAEAAKDGQTSWTAAGVASALRACNAERLSLRHELKTLLAAEWMVTHDWGGDRDAVLASARRALQRKTRV